eukprot:11224553-Lingulodinium_polyedra.AAC.1
MALGNPCSQTRGTIRLGAATCVCRGAFFSCATRMLVHTTRCVAIVAGRGDAMGLFGPSQDN